MLTDKSNAILAVSIVGSLLAMLSVALRLYANQKKSFSLRSDDFFIILALVTSHLPVPTWCINPNEFLRIVYDSCELHWICSWYDLYNPVHRIASGEGAHS